MKTLSPLLLALVLFFQPGCAFLNSPGNVTTVSEIAGFAAYFGSKGYMVTHPESRLAFIAADAALEKLIQATNFNAVEFANVLHLLPTNALSGPNGDLYISAIVVVWSAVAKASTAIQKSALVAATMKSVQWGIHSALYGATPQTSLPAPSRGAYVITPIYPTNLAWVIDPASLRASP